MKTKFIVVAGGVISGVGKGVTTASLGKIFKEYGFSTTLVKIDPYINYDAGTLRPTEHGEVWVTNDGGEIDQDLGTYERFMNQDISKTNNITTGQIYKAVIDRERKGEYLGQTVQFLPHILDEIKRRILSAAQEYEIVIIELGGTVGDYENIPFLHAFKSLERECGADTMAYVLVTYLPIPDHMPEMKTKPTQQAIRQLGQEGILPDFIICRAREPLDTIRKKKIEMCANIAADCIISAPDIKTIYEMPLHLEREGLGAKLLAHFKLTAKQEPSWNSWQELVTVIKKARERISIGVVGKYLESGDYSLTDSYLSIYQALVHAGAHCGIGIDIIWINAASFEHDPGSLVRLQSLDGIIIPGGFGSQGVEGKIAAISYVRRNKIPYLGICYGMQLAAVEYARSVCGLTDAHTTEIHKETSHPIIDILELQKEFLSTQDYGGTMRLGAYDASIKPGTLVEKLYSKTQAHQLRVWERHRHRYEVNPAYVELLERFGLVFSGYHERFDGTRLMEFLELPDHPFFVATQAHPEFKSRLAAPSELFYGFVQASLQRFGKKNSVDVYLLNQKQAECQL